MAEHAIAPAQAFNPVARDGQLATGGFFAPDLRLGNQLVNFRRAAPEYNDLTDGEILAGFYRTFFSQHMTREEFQERLLSPQVPSDTGGPGPRINISNFDQVMAEVAGKEVTAAYREQRAARPGVQKITDWVRAFGQGLFGQHYDEFLGWLALKGLMPAPGDTPQEREQNTIAWERSQGAAFREESPAAALGMEMLGTAPYLLAPGVRGAAGASMAERTFHGTRLGLAAGGVYGHGAAEGGFLSPERLNAALETGRSTGFVGAAAPFAAEAVAPVMNFGANRFSSAARSTRNVNDALQSSGTNRGAVADAMARNPELMPLDVDPALFARAQGIAT